MTPDDFAAIPNHWDDYGPPGWLPPGCDRAEEHCSACGRLMVTTVEPTGMMSRRTGEPTFARWHSCPTWVEGWRAKRWARGWATPGHGHDSHDADNPLLARDYR